MKGPDPAADDSGGWIAAARRFRISGRVQGVGYRAFAARAGRALNLRGGARNLDDGRVEVIASGAVHALDRLEAALGEGPSLSSREPRRRRGPRRAPVAGGPRRLRRGVLRPPFKIGET